MQNSKLRRFLFGTSSVQVKKASKRKKKRSNLEWNIEPQLQARLGQIVEGLEFWHVRTDRVFCYKTRGSTARAYARIWSFPKIFQQVLEIEPAYVIEVLSERFDKLDFDNQAKVLIHELLHIPKNFSGSLLPHKHGGKRIDREVERLFRSMKSR